MDDNDEEWVDSNDESSDSDASDLSEEPSSEEESVEEEEDGEYGFIASSFLHFPLRLYSYSLLFASTMLRRALHQEEKGRPQNRRTQPETSLQNRRWAFFFRGYNA